MNKAALLGASLAILSAATHAAAAQSDSAVSEVIVTGTRAAGGVDADRLGSAVTVISAEEMRDRQIRVVSDVLRDVPGFAVSRTGSLGDLTQVRVRGTEANHVLTLVDGIEAADPFLGEFDFSTLLADDVARVEIIRGPQSALYGSDAIAGVVNYVTLSAREAPGGSLRVEFGGRGTLGGAGRYAVAAGPLDLVANIGMQRTDGYVGQTLPGGVRKLGSELAAYSMRAGYQVSEGLKLRGVVRYTDTRAETDNFSYGQGLVDAPGSHLKARSLLYLAGADLTLLDGAWTHSLSYQGLAADRDGYDAFGRASGDDGLRRKASYVTTYRLQTGPATHALTGAVDWEKETYQNTSPASAGADTTRRSIRNLGLVAQYDLQFGELAGLGAAVRRDDNEVFADATTWKIQGYYRLGEAARLRAAAGTGIKNPSQTELFGYNAAGPFPFVGNPNLKPEKSKGWEVGADLSALQGRLTLAVTYFHARLTNEIFGFFGGTAPPDCPPPPLGVSTTCNRASESTQKGVELSGKAQLTEALSVSGSYTYLKARENGLEEIRRAPHIGSVNLTWRPLQGRATVSLGVQYNGRQLDSNFTGVEPPFPASLPKVRPATGANAGEVVLPSYTLVSLAASYAIADHVELFGRIENLADEDYYEVFGYPTAPRAAYVGARVRF